MEYSGFMNGACAQWRVQKFLMALPFKEGAIRGELCLCQLLMGYFIDGGAQGLATYTGLLGLFSSSMLSGHNENGVCYKGKLVWFCLTAVGFGF